MPVVVGAPALSNVSLAAPSGCHKRVSALPHSSLRIRVSTNQLCSDPVAGMPQDGVPVFSDPVLTRDIVPGEVQMATWNVEPWVVDETADGRSGAWLCATYEWAQAALCTEDLEAMFSYLRYLLTPLPVPAILTEPRWAASSSKILLQDHMPWLPIFGPFPVRASPGVWVHDGDPPLPGQLFEVRLVGWQGVQDNTTHLLRLSSSPDCTDDIDGTPPGGTIIQRDDTGRPLTRQAEFGPLSIVGPGYVCFNDGAGWSLVPGLPINGTDPSGAPRPLAFLDIGRPSSVVPLHVQSGESCGLCCVETVEASLALIATIVLILFASDAFRMIVPFQLLGMMSHDCVSGDMSEIACGARRAALGDWFSSDRSMLLVWFLCLVVPCAIHASLVIILGFVHSMRSQRIQEFCCRMGVPAADSGPIYRNAAGLLRFPNVEVSLFYILSPILLYSSVKLLNEDQSAWAALAIVSLVVILVGWTFVAVALFVIAPAAHKCPIPARVGETHEDIVPITALLCTWRLPFAGSSSNIFSQNLPSVADIQSQNRSPMTGSDWRTPHFIFTWSDPPPVDENHFAATDIIARLQVASGSKEVVQHLAAGMNAVCPAAGAFDEDSHISSYSERSSSSAPGLTEESFEPSSAGDAAAEVHDHNLQCPAESMEEQARHWRKVLPPLWLRPMLPVGHWRGRDHSAPVCLQPYLCFGQCQTHDRPALEHTIAPTDPAADAVACTGHHRSCQLRPWSLSNKHHCPDSIEFIHQGVGRLYDEYRGTQTLCRLASVEWALVLLTALCLSLPWNCSLAWIFALLARWSHFILLVMIRPFRAAGDTFLNTALVGWIAVVFTLAAAWHWGAGSGSDRDSNVPTLNFLTVGIILVTLPIFVLCKVAFLVVRVWYARPIKDYHCWLERLMWRLHLLSVVETGDVLALRHLAHASHHFRMLAPELSVVSRGKQVSPDILSGCETIESSNTAPAGCSIRQSSNPDESKDPSSPWNVAFPQGKSRPSAAVVSWRRKLLQGEELSLQHGQEQAVSSQAANQAESNSGCVSPQPEADEALNKTTSLASSPVFRLAAAGGGAAGGQHVSADSPGHTGDSSLAEALAANQRPHIENSCKHRSLPQEALALLPGTPLSPTMVQPAVLGVESPGQQVGSGADQDTPAAVHGSPDINHAKDPISADLDVEVINHLAGPPSLEVFVRPDAMAGGAPSTQTESPGTVQNQPEAGLDAQDQPDNIHSSHNRALVPELGEDGWWLIGGSSNQNAPVAAALLAGAADSSSASMPLFGEATAQQTVPCDPASRSLGWRSPERADSPRVVLPTGNALVQVSAAESSVYGDGRAGLQSYSQDLGLLSSSWGPTPPNAPLSGVALSYASGGPGQIANTALADVSSSPTTSSTSPLMRSAHVSSASQHGLISPAPLDESRLALDQAAFGPSGQMYNSHNVSQTHEYPGAELLNDYEPVHFSLDGFNLATRDQHKLL